MEAHAQCGADIVLVGREEAIRNAVFRAVEYAQSGIIADVEAHIDVMKVEKNG